MYRSLYLPLMITGSYIYLLFTIAISIPQFFFVKKEKRKEKYRVIEYWTFCPD